MCRNIRVLLNFEPPTTEEEIQAAALQYVRKVSGTRTPGAGNMAVFDRAIAEVAGATRKLLDAMEVRSPPRTREGEREKAKVRAEKRFGPRRTNGVRGNVKGAT